MRHIDNFSVEIVFRWGSIYRFASNSFLLWKKFIAHLLWKIHNGVTIQNFPPLQARYLRVPAKKEWQFQNWEYHQNFQMKSNIAFSEKHLFNTNVHKSQGTVCFLFEIDQF